MWCYLFPHIRRKQETVDQHGIFSQLFDRFVTVTPTFTMKAYNVFFEVSFLQVIYQIL